MFFEFVDSATFSYSFFFIMSKGEIVPSLFNRRQSSQEEIYNLKTRGATKFIKEVSLSR